jgi:glutamine amidotransferase
VVVAETEHGSRFASLVAGDHIVGFQFHPERSGDDGLRMLANTLALVGGRVRDPLQAGQARGAA